MRDTGNNNRKRLRSGVVGQKGWATLDGVNSLEELASTDQGEEHSRQREWQGQNHQNLGQKEINRWRK